MNSESVFLKSHGLFLFHSRLLNLLRLCARFITLKSSKMSSIMETKRVKTSLDDSPKSWINLNIMSRSPPHSPSENRRRVHTCSLSSKYNYICKGKNYLNFNEQKRSFFSIFFFNLFGFSLGLLDKSKDNDSGWCLGEIINFQNWSRVFVLERLYPVFHSNLFNCPAKL